MDYATNPSTFQGQGQAARPQPERPPGQVQTHAGNLHDLASRLDSTATRTESLIGRLFGEPSLQAAENQKNPEPSGALLVAQFGAERIRLQCDRLDSLIGRLEDLA